MKQILIFCACYVNRNLRYGNSKNRFLQFAVIRSRFYLKKFIVKNKEIVQKMGDVVIKLPYAGLMKLQTNDYIDNWLFTGADFEPSVVRQVKKILSKGDNFLDLGANIGYFSLIASRQVGNIGVVYAFEPTPATINKLKINIELNALQNIRVIEKAVSNKNGNAIFKTPTGFVKNSGRSSFRDIEENSAELSVEMVTIDSMLEQINNIKLIKMDIEGAEGLALEGMVKLLQRDRPIIIMELSDYYLKQMGYSAEFVLTFLMSRKYRIYFGEDFNSSIDMNTDLSGFQYDILCIPQ